MKTVLLHGEYKTSSVMFGCCLLLVLLFVVCVLLLAVLFADCCLLVAVVCCVLLCFCSVKTKSLHGEYKTRNVIVGCCLVLAFGVCCEFVAVGVVVFRFVDCWSLLFVVCCCVVVL